MREFETWMELNTDLSNKSIKNYLQGMKTAEENLVSKNMLQLGLSELDSLKELEELKIQYFSIVEFKERDTRGNGLHQVVW
tara:strand:- start:431 stop:673 length:243 start_codon:yes stop_codon:yes gene_type:complete